MKVFRGQGGPLGGGDEQIGTCGTEGEEEERKKGGDLSMLIDPDEQISTVARPGWVEVEITADSGACETVMPLECCPDIEIHQSEGSKKNKHYEVASWHTIKNKGERRVIMMTEGSQRTKKIRPSKSTRMKRRNDGGEGGEDGGDGDGLVPPHTCD